MASKNTFRVVPSWAARALSTEKILGSGKTLNPNNVPIQFHSWIPLAEKWGIADDALRDKLVSEASAAQLQELIEFGPTYEVALEQWLAGPESQSDTPSTEYIAYSALGMACDYAKIISAKSSKP
jgi:hypothetical protein